MKYVSPLSEKQIKKLNGFIKNSPCSRIRIRAHTIILSSRDYTINQIAEIFQVQRNAVSRWIDSWGKSGFKGLHDAPRNGRPSTLTKKEKEIAKKLIKKYPRTLKTVVSKLAEKTGKTVSTKTLKRLAKSANMSWKRIRKSVRAKQNRKEVAKKKKEIRKLEKQQRNGEIDLYYFDEVGFDLQPTVPYAWQKRCEIIEIPSSKSLRFNVLGFFNTANNDFHSFTFKCSITSDIVVECFNQFSQILTKRTVVIIDNSPTHTSDEFIENIEKWEKKRLIINNLPSYSPELNHIEILWKFIKYFWLPFSAYQSFTDLTNEVETILMGIGSEFKINFSST